MKEESCSLAQTNTGVKKSRVKKTEVKLPCPVEGCGLSYATEQGLRFHKAAHVEKGEVGFMCQLCSQEGNWVAFDTNQIFLKHVNKRHPGREPECRFSDC